jgi:restriction system protein
LEARIKKVSGTQFGGALLAEFAETMQEYNDKMQAISKEEFAREGIKAKVEQLYELTPRQFEEWTAGLLETLGFEDVELTPLSRDKGADVLASKGGYKYSIQCKKHKGLIGSPEIQKFIGSMQY